MKKIDLIQRGSFTIFCLGLCSLLIGLIYEGRLVILWELNNIYLFVITMEKVEVIATTIGAITLISFFLFLLCLFQLERMSVKRQNELKNE